MENFKGTTTTDDKQLLEIKPPVGLSFDELKKKFEKFSSLINQKHVDKESGEWIHPDEKNLKISGMIFFEDVGVETPEKRHCPFNIKIVNDGENSGSFYWRIESPIEVSFQLLEKSGCLKDFPELNIEQSNDLTKVYQEIRMDTDMDHVLKMFEYLVFKADEIEKEYSKVDGKSYMDFVSID